MIIFCRCEQAGLVPPATRKQVAEYLAASGRAYESVADVCGLAARGRKALRRAAQGRDLTVVACHPRAVRWLFDAAGATLEAGARLLDARAQSAEQILDALRGIPPSDAPKATLAAVPGPDDGWAPWFPVIDRDRCINCKQCLNFCLFGVYEQDDDGRVRVANPARCKLNCPACARLCPQVAIIFPKYPHGAISGDEVLDEDLQRQDLKVDVSKLSRGDLLDALRQRSRQP